jgi:Predicted EndoIII-related endonuclease
VGYINPYSWVNRYLFEGGERVRFLGGCSYRFRGLHLLASIADVISGSEVFRILSEAFRIDVNEYVALVAHSLGEGAFPVLVSIILSQNTSDRNSIRAFLRLKEGVGVRLEDILGASVEDIAYFVREAGLWRQKAETIKRVAEVVARLGGEDFLLKEDPFKVREELLKVKGVGFKTVDVFLSVTRRAPVFAVDTHAMRVALRWGLARRGVYEEVSRALLEYFGVERAEEAHRLLIALGRRVCKARRPRCWECPLATYCPSSLKR